MTIKDRILTYIEKSGLKRSDFFAKTEISPSNFKGKAMMSEVGGDKIAKILTHYPEINPEWLLLGSSSMLKKKEEIIPVLCSEKKGIPLIPHSAMAGAFSGDLSVMDWDCERYIVPAFKCADFLISVRGDSMTPLLDSGDIVACKIIKERNPWWQQKRAYVLDTVQGPIIKHVSKGSDENYLTIISENKEYDTFELHKENIRNVALVLGVIKTF